METLKHKINQLEANPTPKGFQDLYFYVIGLEADIKAEQEKVNDAMSELWALVDQQRNLLNPYADKDFSLDLSHIRSK